MRVDIPFLYTATVTDGTATKTLHVLDSHAIELPEIAAEECPLAARVNFTQYPRTGTIPVDIHWDGAGFRSAYPEYRGNTRELMTAERFLARVAKGQETPLQTAQGLKPLRVELGREIPKVNGRAVLPDGFVRAAALAGMEVVSTDRGAAVARLETDSADLAVVNGLLTVRCGKPYYEIITGGIAPKLEGQGAMMAETSCAATDLDTYLRITGKAVTPTGSIEVFMPEVLHLREHRLEERQLTYAASATFSMFEARPLHSVSVEDIEAYHRLKGAFRAPQEGITPEYLASCRELVGIMGGEEWARRLAVAIRRYEAAFPVPTADADPDAPAPGPRR